MKCLPVCITFDIDFVEHLGGETVDEVDLLTRLPILSILQAHDCRATWFVRLDRRMGVQYGDVTYAFQKYAGLLDKLRQSGHEIGWHPHCYTSTGEGWQQNTVAAEVVNELTECAVQAQAYQLKAVRMGWGFHTNETLRLLAELGFAVDSSAIPRPHYHWEPSQKDWTLTPLTPYYPSQQDYRVPGVPALPIIEAPISVADIPAPYDTESVIRYINLAFHPAILRAPLTNWLARHEHLITITHPYELAPRPDAHGLLAFDPAALDRNLRAMQEIAAEQGRSISFLTMSEFASVAGRG